MLNILILVCALGTPVHACTKDKALSFTQGPTVAMPYECLSQGQTIMAKTALVDDQTYTKVICERSKN